MKTQSLNLENFFKKALFASFLTIILIQFGLSDGNAQITIDNSYKIAVNDGYTTVAVDTTGLNEGNAGPNQTWSFTNLTELGSPLSVEFKTPSSGSGSSNFPGATLVQEIDGSWTYMKEENNSYFAMGMYSNDMIRTYSDMQKLMQYPFSFNSTFTDTYKSTFMIEDTEVRSTGTVTMTADAWGTITLPSGTYPNALRIKTVTNNTDTMMISGFPFVTSSVNTSYSWYVSGKKFPIFGITYIASDLFNVKSASYVTNFTTSISQNSQIADSYKLEQNYPNPFNPSTSINFSITKSGMTSLKVYDMLGKEVATLMNGNLNAGSYTATFDASSLPSGVYFYKLQTEGFSEIKKMSLVK